MSERLDTKTDTERIGDEVDPWDLFLDGMLDFSELSASDKARATRFLGLS
jgi:hypothetical protein